MKLRKRLPAGKAGKKKKRTTPFAKRGGKNSPLFRSDDIDITKGLEQTLELMEFGRDNMYITGKAGTGKSTLLKHFVLHTNKKHVVLAPTGVAAMNVKGSTIHSFFQFPLGTIEEDDIQFLFQKKSLFEELELIIIDEISMVRSDIMHAIDLALRKNKDPYLPFGGVQIIMFGDLYQLPPVVREKEEEAYLKERFGGKYFFYGPALKKTGLKRIELCRNFRQQDDQSFLAVLNSVREKSVSRAHLDVLNARVGEYTGKQPIITLATTNRVVDTINKEELAELRGKEYEYEASVDPSFDMGKVPVETTLKLKKGAQVMMVKNDYQSPRRWVNGTLATIVKLSKESIVVEIEGKKHAVEKARWEEYDFVLDPDTNDIEKVATGSCVQYPLRLAWAITIHKSQGQTLDRAVIDLGRGAFAHGQTYVALSRCRSLDTIHFARPVRWSDIIVDREVQEFHGK